MGLISWIIVGAIAGMFARWVMPGEGPGGFGITVLVGMAGAARPGSGEPAHGVKPGRVGLHYGPRYRRGRPGEAADRRAGSAAHTPAHTRVLSVGNAKPRRRCRRPPREPPHRVRPRRCPRVVGTTVPTLGHDTPCDNRVRATFTDPERAPEWPPSSIRGFYGSAHRCRVFL
jgi:hypothetical protein